MDLWTVIQKHILRLPALNYALVGRWVLWMPKGKFRHLTIASTPARRGEGVAGWGMHYLTGVVFASIPLGLSGPDWFWHPSLLAGLLSFFAPFLIMQPAFGFGIAAADTPYPMRARLLSITTHLAYGLGLYIAPGRWPEQAIVSPRSALSAGGKPRNNNVPVRSMSGCSHSSPGFCPAF